MQKPGKITNQFCTEHESGGILSFLFTSLIELLDGLKERYRIQSVCEWGVNSELIVCEMGVYEWGINCAWVHTV